jgi:hypothetical protein
MKAAPFFALQGRCQAGFARPVRRQTPPRSPEVAGSISIAEPAQPGSPFMGCNVGSSRGSRRERRDPFFNPKFESRHFTLDAWRR